MKRGILNRILEEYIFIQRLCVVSLSSFKINRIAVCRSFFVKKKYGLHDCQPFIVLCLIFWRVKYITELHFFLMKFSFGPYTRNPFALEGYHWIMLSVLSLFILFPVVFSVAFWSSFGYARTTLYIFYLYLQAICFFCCRIIKMVRGRRKLTFQTTAFRKVIRAKISF